MGLVIYFVLTLFCGYMAFELGRYVIATGDALPLIIVLLLALLSIHCIKQIYKAIKNKASISWTELAFHVEQSGGRSRVLCWNFGGYGCFAGGYTSKQGKSR